MADLNRPLNSIAPKLASTIQATDTMVVMSTDGDTSQTPIFEAVAKANGENGCLCVRYFDTLVSSADVKLINTTPFQILPAPPVGFEYSFHNIYMSAVYAGTPYATFIQMELLGLSGSVVTFSEDLLGFSTNIASRRLPLADFTVTKANATGAVVLTNSTGNPTAGTSDIRIRGEYVLIPL